MNILPKFKVDIVKGKIYPEKKSEYYLYLESLEQKKDNKHHYGFQLSIKTIRGTRSLDQNGRYWGYINPVLAEAMGSASRMEAHEDLIMMRYPNGRTIKKTLPNGQIAEYKERIKSSEMNVKEFLDFSNWCEDFGILEFQIIWQDDYDKDDK